eukprot:3520312-Alexandrium_andersonii.AAC.1
MHREVRSRTEQDEFLDYEAFVCRMVAVRRWAEAKSHSEWTALLNNPKTERDNGGWKNALRLRIPS